jgi:twitching motility protein PilT
MDIRDLLVEVYEKNGSDLHLSAGVSPMYRLDGELLKFENYPAISDSDLKAMLKKIMPDELSVLLDNKEEKHDADFSFEFSKNARCRANVFKQLNGIGAAFRIIPAKVPTLEELGMPQVLKDLCNLPNGIVLITGPTGSGKTTTLAAMVNYLSQRKASHIITIEDPIEFIFPNKVSLIQQREVHRDTKSFTDALRSALREDPNIILVGEMRDMETIKLALTAAETGHLVLTTLHTSSAVKTVNRIVDVFSSSEKEMVQTIFAESLQAVVAQTLLKRKGGGRIAALEILIATPAVRNLIRENKVAQIESIMQTSKKFGMRTYEQSLNELLNSGMIDYDIDVMNKYVKS